MSFAVGEGHIWDHPDIQIKELLPKLGNAAIRRMSKRVGIKRISRTLYPSVRETVRFLLLVDTFVFMRSKLFSILFHSAPI